MMDAVPAAAATPTHAFKAPANAPLLLCDEEPHCTSLFRFVPHSSTNDAEPEVEHRIANWDEAGADWRNFNHAAMASGKPPADGIAPHHGRMRRHTSQNTQHRVNVLYRK